MKNLVGVWPNLSRAYEIALLGNYRLCIIYDRDDYPTGQQDYISIKEFFKDVNYSYEHGLIVQILPPNWDRMQIADRCETLEDIHRRVEKAKALPVPIWKVNEASNSILRMAIERLHLSIYEIRFIKDVSARIAMLDGNPYIQPQHVAEAINYQIGRTGDFVYAEGATRYFGPNIIIQEGATLYDMERAVNYLTSFLP